MKRIFQVIVVGGLAMQILWFFFPYTWVYLYSGEELDLLSWHGYGAYIDINGSIPYAILFAYIIVSVGLVSFMKWARITFLLLTIASVLSAPLWGFSVSPGLDGIFGNLLVLADGAILTMMYLTGISGLFENDA